MSRHFFQFLNIVMRQHEHILREYDFVNPPEATESSTFYLTTYIIQPEVNWFMGSFGGISLCPFLREHLRSLYKCVIRP